MTLKIKGLKGKQIEMDQARFRLPGDIGRNSKSLADLWPPRQHVPPFMLSSPVSEFIVYAIKIQFQNLYGFDNINNADDMGGWKSAWTNGRTAKDKQNGLPSGFSMLNDFICGLLLEGFVGAPYLASPRYKPTHPYLTLFSKMFTYIH